LLDWNLYLNGFELCKYTLPGMESGIYCIFQAIKSVWQLKIVSETLENINAATNGGNIIV